mmetsp:Transcript_9720/g.14979  ORF Transcript_9720/g.14979 Transcript_9720/m.14979 type:complete len:280 (+) Transcript_9720:37-876(+)
MVTLKRWTPPTSQRREEEPPVDDFEPQNNNTNIRSVMQLLNDLDDDDSSSADSFTPQTKNEENYRSPMRSLLLRLARYLFFLASAFYLIGAVLNAQDMDGGSFANSLGALLFVVTGALEYCTERVFFNLFLILAGIFGFASEVVYDVYDTNEKGSNVLNSISVHMFLLESLKLLYQHWCNSSSQASSLRRKSFTALTVLWLSDIFFFGGSVMDVVCSWSYFSNEIDYTVTDHAEVVGATFWVLSSLLAIYFSCKMSRLSVDFVQEKDHYSVETVMTNIV